jgi:hypothetical protein
MLLVHELLDQFVLRHRLALDQVLHQLVALQELLHVAQVLLQILDFEPRWGLVHGICAPPIRVEIVAMRPARYAVSRPRS